MPSSGEYNGTFEVTCIHTQGTAADIMTAIYGYLKATAKMPNYNVSGVKSCAANSEMIICLCETICRMFSNRMIIVSVTHAVWVVDLLTRYSSSLGSHDYTLRTG
jgi:hypothetical protein